MAHDVACVSGKGDNADSTWFGPGRSLQREKDMGDEDRRHGRADEISPSLNCVTPTRRTLMCPQLMTEQQPRPRAGEQRAQRRQQ